MIKAVIFDMDGVIIDSQPIHYEADKLALKSVGIDVSYNDLEKYAGTSNINRFTRFKKDFNLILSIKDFISIQQNIIFSLVAKAELLPISGIKELLESLKSNDIKIAVASSSSYIFIDTILNSINVKNYFTQVVSGEDMANSKPAPDIFLATAAKLNTEPSECVVIEDSMNGVLAAKEAGMKCIGYVNINSGSQDLSKATVIIDDFAKIDAGYVTKLN